MKIYHSYWEYGWNSFDERLYNMHRLSVLCALKNYGNITLITTEKGKKILGDLPYTNIELYDDNIPTDFSTVWSVNKLYAYKQIAKKNEPFFHIDYDVFLFKKLPEWFEKSKIVFQHIESNLNDNEFYNIDYFFKKCKNTYLAKYKNNYAYNLAIFGGNDFKSIEYYVDKSFELLFDQNNIENYWLNHNLPIMHCSKTVILEQWYLTYCLENLNIKPTPLLPDNNKLDEDAVKYGFCHVWGAKHNQEIHDKIKNKIKISENELFINNIN